MPGGASSSPASSAMSWSGTTSALWLFRPHHRQALLSGRNPDEPAAGRLRGLRGRFRDATLRCHDLRRYRRSRGAWRPGCGRWAMAIATLATACFRTHDEIGVWPRRWSSPSASPRAGRGWRVHELRGVRAETAVGEQAAPLRRAPSGAAAGILLGSAEGSSATNTLTLIRWSPGAGVFPLLLGVVVAASASFCDGAWSSISRLARRDSSAKALQGHGWSCRRSAPASSTPSRPHQLLVEIISWLGRYAGIKAWVALEINSLNMAIMPVAIPSRPVSDPHRSASRALRLGRAPRDPGPGR